ncbi:cobaltochelatase subunit CobN [Methyloversatilis thermotolerans]|uniref:cobaltochelatase subunit CobN n=1 Tax=Methyloversatilis thermotolerans TaxID=1346290 RepID=UPI000375D30D|nr:cobaltochelatase subunit CobN [Methyloversatilis thermotolerans]
MAMRLFALCLLCCGLSLPAMAATVFAVVSERAAPDVAAAAAVLAADPAFARRHTLRVRTPAQIEAMSAAELGRALAAADTVLAVAAFGESGPRLRHALEALPPRPAVFAFNAEGPGALAPLTRRGTSSLQAWSPEALSVLLREPADAASAARGDSDALLREWRALRALWQAGGADNLVALLRHLAQPGPLPAVRPVADLIWRVDGRAHGDDEMLALPADGPVVAVLDLVNQDAHIADAQCAALRARGLRCVAVMARWGEATRRAVLSLPARIAPARLSALVVLQDFVLGAAEGREAVTAALQSLDVPVFKALRLQERSRAEWALSADGLPAASVQYRIALPELQGVGQPQVVAVAGPLMIDALTGVQLRRPQPLQAEMARLAARVARWQSLRDTPPAQRRIALIYYNHPPGRQNIGADNLDVPASLLQMLQALQAAGYHTGALPDTPEALLDMLMDRGVNLPEDGRELARLARELPSLGATDYQRWFDTLPLALRLEVAEGAPGRIHGDVLAAREAGLPATGRARIEHGVAELRHLLEGIEHPRRERALALLDTIERAWLRCVARDPGEHCAHAAQLRRDIVALGIPGLRGWGRAPGRVMVSGGRLVIPGLQFGNVWVGPQPPRGWEVDEELLHANTSIPPPHQYLAVYQWLREHFRADALVHVGRHSTYEFLPGKAVGLAATDYPSLIAGDLPGIYPYIVDGVGEGTQAKRRGGAVMIDHLTPPLSATPLYDSLLTLRQLVESFESSSSDELRARAAGEMRRQVEALELRAELEASMADVLTVRGLRFEQVDDELLAHEIGHYLTKLQEKFMPLGLHVFGRRWSEQALDTMMVSMARGDDADMVRARLAASPDAEMAALLAALDGRFVAPGKGNDPLRAPDALPTGRNFHAVDGDVLPTRLGHALGREQAARVLARPAAGGSEGVVMWASDAVRDEGVMLGFSLALMGVEPQWNARGVVQGLTLAPAPEGGRRDVIVTTSGLFRDLYPNLVNMLDRAGRLALAASAHHIAAGDDRLAQALRAALAPLGDAVPAAGDEPLDSNAVASQWRQRAQALMAAGHSPEQAGRAAAWRVFGDAPGAYGAGVNRLAERSGSWQSRVQLGRVYLRRMGHAYGLDAGGEPAHAAFDLSVAQLARTYHGRASNLYGLLDNNDAFDYLGGLSLAAETLTGRVPDAQVLYNADPARTDVQPLATALLSELRGRYLNPEWIGPLMGHGYAGARTFGQEFMENLWGWQVTRPDLIRDWAWEEVKQVYLDDRHGLGLPAFLERGHNGHVKAQMLAIMLVAVHKGFWQADDATVRRLAHDLVAQLRRTGLPGSGHTAPGHPMWDWLVPRLDDGDARSLRAVLDGARGESAARPAVAADAATRPGAAAPAQRPDEATAAASVAASAALKWTELQRAPAPAPSSPPWPLAALAVLLVAVGAARGAGLSRFR